MNSKVRKPTEAEWARARAMTDEQVHAAAIADPDAQPLTGDELGKMRRAPLSKRIRRKLRLTQEEFANRYRLPVGTVRDWDQCRAEPDAAAKALLKTIELAPDLVAFAQLSRDEIKEQRAREMSPLVAETNRALSKIFNKTKTQSEA